MSQRQPKVSIGLPVYNGENYISEAIETVLNQTFKDFELVISDNASTDRTQEICDEYARKDPRIHYYRSEQNLGAGWNFNRVYELSCGQYFKWLAHDDLMAPDYLTKAVAVLDQDSSQTVLCYPRVRVIDANRNPIYDYSIKLPTDSPHAVDRFRSLLLDWSLCFEVFGLIRMSALKMTPGMGVYGHGDGVLLAQLSLLGKFEEIPEVLAFSRKHANQSMSQFGLSESGGNNYHLYTFWFDPSQKGKIIFPNWKILKEFLISLWLYKLDAKTRALGHIYLLVWIKRHARHLARDLFIAATEIYRRMIRGIKFKKANSTTTPQS